jgi:hypothetical protein
MGAPQHHAQFANIRTHPRSGNKQRATREMRVIWSKLVVRLEGVSIVMIKFGSVQNAEPGPAFSSRDCLNPKKHAQNDGDLGGESQRPCPEAFLSE